MHTQSLTFKVARDLVRLMGCTLTRTARGWRVSLAESHRMATRTATTTAHFESFVDSLESAVQEAERLTQVTGKAKAESGRISHYGWSPR